MSRASAIPFAVAADEAWRPLIDGALRDEVDATVETAFAHAVNLSISGESFSLLASGGRPAPGALILWRTDFHGVRSGTRVTFRADADGLVSLEFTDPTLPDRVIELRDVGYFDSRLHPVSRSEVRGRLDPDAAAQFLTDLARPGSFIPAQDDPPFSRAVRARLAELRSDFGSALVTQAHGPAALGDNTACLELRAVTASLIGLGIGLTPSGDDYLVGALALLAAHPSAEAVVAREALAACVTAVLQPPDGPDRTTTVSRGFLVAAVRGSFHSDLAAAARAVLTGDPRAVSAAFASVAAIGSTSGTDALYGLIDAYTAIEAPPVPHRKGRRTRPHDRRPLARNPESGTP